MTDPDRTVSQEEAQEILSQYTINPEDEVNLKFEEQAVVMVFKDEEFKLEFISLDDDPELVMGEGRSYTTVSRYFIHTEDEVVEVETDGPFNLTLEGLGVTELGDLSE